MRRMRKRAPVKKVHSVDSNFYKVPISVIYQGNEQIYYFENKEETLTELMTWCYENTQHRFNVIGTTHFYFEDEGDTVTFKMHFGDKR